MNDPVSDRLRLAVERIDRVCKTHTRDDMPGCVWETLVNVQATCERAVDELENGYPFAVRDLRPHRVKVCPCAYCRGLRAQRDALNGQTAQDIREQDERDFNEWKAIRQRERLDGER